MSDSPADITPLPHAAATSARRDLGALMQGRSAELGRIIGSAVEERAETLQTDSRVFNGAGQAAMAWRFDPLAEHGHDGGDSA